MRNDKYLLGMYFSYVLHANYRKSHLNNNKVYCTGFEFNNITSLIVLQFPSIVTLVQNVLIRACRKFLQVGRHEDERCSC